MASTLLSAKITDTGKLETIWSTPVGAPTPDFIASLYDTKVISGSIDTSSTTNNRDRDGQLFLVIPGIAELASNFTGCFNMYTMYKAKKNIATLVHDLSIIPSQTDLPSGTVTLYIPAAIFQALGVVGIGNETGSITVPFTNEWAGETTVFDRVKLSGKSTKQISLRVASGLTVNTPSTVSDAKLTVDGTEYSASSFVQVGRSEANIVFNSVPADLSDATSIEFSYPTGYATVGFSQVNVNFELFTQTFSDLDDPNFPNIIPTSADVELNFDATDIINGHLKIDVFFENFDTSPYNLPISQYVPLNSILDATIDFLPTPNSAINVLFNGIRATDDNTLILDHGGFGSTATREQATAPYAVLVRGGQVIVIDANLEVFRFDVVPTLLFEDDLTITFDEVGNALLLESGTVDFSGIILTLTFNVPIDQTNPIAAATNDINVETEFSDLSSAVYFGPNFEGLAPNQANYFVLGGTIIRENDIVNLTLFEDSVQTFGGLLSNVDTTITLVNNSTGSYPQPSLVSSEVTANQLLELVYDIPITPGPALSSIVVTAKESSVDRNSDVTINAVNPSFSNSNKTVKFSLNGDVYNTDDLTLASNAGHLSSETSVLAGAEVFAPPLNVDPLTNNSVQDAPPAGVAPLAVDAFTNTDGTKLFINWDKPVQHSTGTVDLDASTTGNNITCTPDGVQTGTQNKTLIYALGDTVVSGETLDADIASSAVVSLDTATANAVNNNFPVENASIILDTDVADIRPTVQDVMIGRDGRSIGVWYDVPVTYVAGEVTLTSSLRGEQLTATTIDATNEDTLIVDMLLADKEIFSGEIVQASVPANLASNSAASSGLASEAATIECENNSDIVLPLAPVVDVATINTSGDILTLTFSTSVEHIGGTFTLQASQSGNHNCSVGAISNDTVTCNIDGLIFSNDIVTLSIPAGTFKETDYGQVSNKVISKQSVTNNSTDTFPSIGDPLNESS